MRTANSDDFYVAADDENWYRAQAFTLLDSLRIPYRTADRAPMRFVVDGQPRTYDWNDRPAGWFVVIYDGAREPRITHSVDLPLDTTWFDPMIQRTAGTGIGGSASRPTNAWMYPGTGSCLSTAPDHARRMTPPATGTLTSSPLSMNRRTAQFASTEMPTPAFTISRIASVN
jgi:hypothetical protein